MTGACDFECMVPGRAAYHRSSSGVDRSIFFKVSPKLKVTYAS
jgi:hypothetical protein